MRAFPPTPSAWRPRSPCAFLHSTRTGKAGFVYKLGQKNGKANIDEYAPIFSPDEWKSDGDQYEPGLPGLAAWLVTLGAVLLGGAFAVYSTSAL